MVTAFVGFCHRQGLPSRAIAVDRFVRGYTFISYYGCVLGIFVNLEEQNSSKSFIFFVAFQVPLVFVVLIFIELSQLAQKRRIRRLVNELGELHSLSGIEARSLVWQLIRTWNKRDLDALDKIQLRYILRIFHPGVSHDKAIIAIDQDPTGTMYNADKIGKLLQMKVDNISLSTITASALELTSRQVKAEPKVEAKEETKEEMPQVVVRTENRSTEMQSTSTRRPAEKAAAYSVQNASNIQHATSLFNTSAHDAEDAAFNALVAAESLPGESPQLLWGAPTTPLEQSLSQRTARKGFPQAKGLPKTKGFDL